MRKMLLAIAAFAGAQGAFAATADDVEFKMNAELRARYENWMTPSASSSNSESKASVKGRAKLNVTARKGERYQMMVSLLHSSLYGESFSYNTDQANAGIPNNGSADRDVIISRAWGWWKATDNLNIKVGRFGIDLADGSVFSDNDWEQVPATHEGLVINYDMDFAKISLYAIKNRMYGAGNGFPAWDPQQNMYFVSFDLKNLPEVLKTANIHIMQVSRDQVAQSAGSVNAAPNSATPVVGFDGSGGVNSLAGVNEQRAGLALGGEVAGIMYKLDGAYVTGTGKLSAGNIPGTTSGTDYTISQSMIDALLGYHLPDLIGMKVAVGYHTDSGSGNQFNGTQGSKTLGTYDPLFYDRHTNGGLMDVVRWGNLTYYDATLAVMPMDDLEVGLGYYVFSRSASGSNSGANVFGANYADLRGSLSDSAIGSELDAFVNKSYESNFKIAGHFGMFMPDSYLKNATGANAGGRQDQTIMQLMLQGTMTF